MIHAIQAFIAAVEGTAVGSGEPNSPLAANSLIAEFLRVLQFAIIPAAIYIVKTLKENRGVTPDEHAEVLAQIEGIKNTAKTVNDTVDENFKSLEQRFDELEKHI